MKNDKSAPKILSDNTFPVVGIGASAGGLNAFKKLIKAIPESSGMAYVLVQHLDPDYESNLPELLQKVTQIPVLVITDEIKVAPDHIYIIPSNRLLVANDGILELSPRPEKGKGHRNLPIDLFFTSLAEIHGAGAIGVVLSGTASDGTIGLKAIKDHGGITFAQDEASAEYDGMPQSAIQAGVVDFILPPEEIPAKLVAICRQINHADEALQNIPAQELAAYKQIIQLLRIRKGTDFTYYKQPTIRRRILRRMAVNKCATPAAYHKFLQENKEEQYALYQDLLIPVTTFFRDPKTFNSLCESVFPHLVEAKDAGEPFRIWVAACSTGQEAYSMAMCLKEFIGGGDWKVQIFATDISEPAIAKARTGFYTMNEVADISPQRLKEFFIKADEGYRIKKVIRDMCVFAVHNFLKDPPFSRIDFVSCRNVLIYLEPYLQKKALTTFHYALNAKGFLLLGKSETSSIVPDLFAAAGKGDKIFTRKDAVSRLAQVISPRGEQNIPIINSNHNSEKMRTDFQKTVDEILLSQYTPVGVVVNDAMDIVHYRGDSRMYLEQLNGAPTQNLLKLAKSGLSFELRNIIQKAKKEGTAVVKESIPLQVDKRQIAVTVKAIPLPNLVEPHYLILFGETSNAPILTQNFAASGQSGDEKDLLIQQLRAELAQNREDMRAITEEQEAANEELQSANEELLSGSEEMQSLNEELETSKEELQSTNEELTVINQELLHLNEQLSTAKIYSEAIIATTYQPLLVLDKNLRVKTANHAFYKAFHVGELETEDVLVYDLGNGQWNIPALRTLLEEVLPQKSEFADFEVTHNFTTIGERVILLSGIEIMRDKAAEKLILLAIEDITERKKAEEVLKKSEAQFRQLADSMPQIVWTARPDGYLDYYNKQWYDYTGFKEAYGDQSWMPILHPDDAARCHEAFYNSINTGTPYQIEYRFKDLKNPGAYRWFIGRALAVKDDGGNIIKWFGTCTDIQDQKQAEEQERQARKHFHFIADAMPQKVWTADAKGNLDYINQSGLDYSGTTLETLKDWQWERIVHPDDWAETQKVWRHSIDTGDAFEVEHRFLGRDGIYRWNLTRSLAQKDEDGTVKMWIGTNTEIQEQKEEKESLEKAVETRTRQLKIANDALLAKNSELQQMNTELESFTYVSSHDLQEPLRKIQTFAALIRAKEQAVLSDKGKESFQRIESAAARMQTLIQDLLAFSHANRGEKITEKTDLNKILAEVMGDLEDSILEKGATVDTHELCEAAINSFQFRQLLQNLFTNALKFTKPGIPPHITIACEIAPGADLAINNPALPSGKLAPDHRYCHITFGDNGIGFEPEYSEKMFEVFQRLNTRAQYAAPALALPL